MNVLFCIIWFILTHTKGYTINTLIHSTTGHHSVTYLLLSKILGLIFWVLFDGGLGLRGWGLQHFDQRDCQCGAQSRSVHKLMLHKWRTMLVHHPFKVFYTYMYTHCYCVEGACTCTCTCTMYVHYIYVYKCTHCLTVKQRHCYQADKQVTIIILKYVYAYMYKSKDRLVNSA